MIFEFVFGSALDDTASLDAGTSSIFDGSFDIVFAGAGDETVEFSDFSDNRIYLGAGADSAFVGTSSTVRGGAGDDLFVVIPLDGSNLLFGGAGNDLLFANGGDQLFGGAGDDVLTVVETGGSLLAGGSGADEFRIANAQLPEFSSVIADFDSAEGDAIVIAGFGSIGFDDLILEVIGEDTLVSLSADRPLALVLGVTTLAETDFVFEPGTGDAAVPGTSTVVGIDAFGVVIGDGQTENGTADAEIITVLGDGNVVSAGSGDDELNIAEGTGNTLNGGTGNDLLDGSDSSGNTLNGLADDDTIFAGAGDTAIGGIGNDRLFDLSAGGGGITFDLSDGGFDTAYVVTDGQLPAAPNIVDGFVSGQSRLAIAGVPDVDGIEDLTITPAANGTDADIAIGDVTIATLTGVAADDLSALDFFFAEDLSVVEAALPELDVPAVDEITIVSIGDDLAAGGVLGTIGVTTFDDRAVALDILSADGSAFTGIDVEPDGDIVVTDPAALADVAQGIFDGGGASFFDLTVTGTNPTGTVEAPLAVPFDLAGVDEAPFFDPNSILDAIVARNAAVDTVVLDLAAVDPEGGLLTFSLAAAAEGVSLDADGDGIDAFGIDGDGVITVTDTDDLLAVDAAGDFVLASPLLLTATVADAPLGQTDAVTVTVTLDDVDVEEPPFFNPAPPDAVDFPVTSVEGDAAFTFEVVDPEGGDLTFSLSVPEDVNLDPDGDGTEAFGFNDAFDAVVVTDSTDLPFLTSPIDFEVAATDVAGATVAATTTVNLTGFDLDVDGNGVIEAQTDVLNILRVELNTPVAAIVLGDGTPPAIDQQVVADVIGAALDIEAPELDFDGNGEVTALEDILNLLRVELNVPTAAIVVGAGSDSTQAEVEAQIDALIGAAEPII